MHYLARYIKSATKRPTPEEYGEYSVEPGALVAPLALYFTATLLLLVLASPKSNRETGTKADSDGAKKEMARRR